MKTNDRSIVELMKEIHGGKIQLPDFQRGWVWDDYRIRSLMASISCNYPVGAAMFLEYGNQNIRFKYRTIQGVHTQNMVPSELVLDGQQRLTSIYGAMYCDEPVHTRTDKGKQIDRYYYLDIRKCLDDNIDRIDAIVSVPSNRIITSDFGRKIELDLSTPDKEYKNHMYPLNIILDFAKSQKWQQEYFQYHQLNQQVFLEFTQFGSQITMPIMQYTMPVILLDKETPKEAVCQVFENVNTGGVSLTVFELVTAVFAMDDFELRKDWESRQQKYFQGDILTIINATDFLTACTLLSSYKKGKTVSCKKKDVLNFTLEEYRKYADDLSEGFVEAEKILNEERIFASRDLPYTTQLIPLAVLCTLLQSGGKIRTANVKEKIKQWYWCGVFGEMYGSANETRYVADVTGVMEWIADESKMPKTVQEAYFNPMRLLSLQSRLSAAYKGIMALILKNKSKDFISGREMDFTVYKSDAVDIHHVFPKDYCMKSGYPKSRWNSIINKTPLSYRTNREIGGVAPSKYLSKIEKKGQVTEQTLNSYLESHWLDVSDCRQDNFDEFIIKRASKLLDAIEKAMGKPVSGRDSEEVIQSFGKGL